MYEIIKLECQEETETCHFFTTSFDVMNCVAVIIDEIFCTLGLYNIVIRACIENIQCCSSAVLSPIVTFQKENY